MKLKQGIYDGGQVEIVIKNDVFFGHTNIEEVVDCELFFWGNLKDINGLITIYNPIDESVNKGNLTCYDKGIKIKSDEVLFPCQRVIDLVRGWEFDYEKKTKWENCAFDFIKSIKSSLYSSPNQLTKRKSYLVKNDIVFVFEEKGEWVKVKYIENDKTFFWIKKDDLYGVPRPV